MITNRFKASYANQTSRVVRFKQTSHKPKDTLVMIKQETEIQKLKRKEKQLGQDDSNIKNKSAKYL
jgi:hypothetical protein